jgi:DNA-binding response OmpR family regulator
MDLSTGLEKQTAGVSWATSGSQALSMITADTMYLVITDETLGDMTGLEFVKHLVAVNPMVNCAAISSLSEEDYHEASEGLGILMQLPPKPDQNDGKRLMAHLNQIMNLTPGTK